jgi:hypothetical protein
MLGADHQDIAVGQQCEIVAPLIRRWVRVVHDGPRQAALEVEHSEPHVAQAERIGSSGERDRGGRDRNRTEHRAARQGDFVAAPLVHERPAGGVAVHEAGGRSGSGFVAGITCDDQRPVCSERGRRHAHVRSELGDLSNVVLHADQREHAVTKWPRVENPAGDQDAAVGPDRECLRPVLNTIVGAERRELPEQISRDAVADDDEITRAGILHPIAHACGDDRAVRGEGDRDELIPRTGLALIVALPLRAVASTRARRGAASRIDRVRVEPIVARADRGGRGDERIIFRRALGGVATGPVARRGVLRIGIAHHRAARQRGEDPPQPSTAGHHRRSYPERTGCVVHTDAERWRSS